MNAVITAAFTLLAVAHFGAAMAFGLSGNSAAAVAQFLGALVIGAIGAFWPR